MYDRHHLSSGRWARPVSHPGVAELVSGLNISINITVEETELLPQQGSAWLS